MRNKASKWMFLGRLLCLFSIFLLPKVEARIIDDVNVATVDDNFKIEFSFSTPMRVTAVSSLDFARSIEIQLAPEGLASGISVDDIQGRYSPSWNRRQWSPIREIIYDGDDPDFPYITLRFTGRVKIDAQSSADMMGLVVSVDASQVKRPLQAPTTSSGDLLSRMQLGSSDLMQNLKQVKTYLLSEQYAQAVPLLTKLRDETDGENRRIAHELLAVARELNGQKAHAKAEYESYLLQYPDDEDSQRVRQRLTVMLTSAVRPEQAQADMASSWQQEFYGSFGQRYYRDEASPSGAPSYVLRDQLTTDLDFVHRASNDNWSIKSQFVGSYRDDRQDATQSLFIPNVASVEIKHQPSTLYGRIGRQTRNTGGVLGRFDGLHMSYDASDDVVVNAVYGHPVDVTEKDKINSDVTFYGASVDLLGLGSGWDLSAYYITQDIFNVKDREAVGSEFRYSDKDKSLFAMVDYDVYFSELNSFMFLGNWSISDATRFNLTLDYRYSPVLTKLNAIQGQPVFSFDELFPLYSDAELKQLAMDRTARMKTATGSITHTLSDRWQVIADITASEFGETVASGGVDAIPATDMEYYYSAQFVGNSVFLEDDIAIFGARYSDTTNADVYTLTGNWRVVPSRKLRINPRLRVDYRTNKGDSGNRTVIKPSIRVDYRLRKWARLELELGYEWYDEQYVVGDYKNETSFITLGYRAEF